MPLRYFTVEEANALLPRLRALIEAMWEARAAILAARPDMEPVLEAAMNNGGSQRASEVVAEFERLQNIVHEIREMGCVLRDMEKGLVDFLSRRDGQEVYLCWHYGEERVAFWHELRAGFAGRRPL